MATLKIHSSTEWAEVESKLRYEIFRLPYNPDLHRLLKNIGLMVTSLSKLEVEARRQHDPRILNEQLDSINRAIQQLDRLIVWAGLTG